MAYARAKGNTSVFVTADHAHTSQIIEVGSSSPGKTVTLLTEDGAPMAVNYGTSTGSSQQHTGAQLRLAGYGPQAANVVGLTDQTDLFFTIKRALGLADDAAHASDHARVIATPKKVKKGGQVSVLAQQFNGDRNVVITVKDPNGHTSSSTRELSGGEAILVFKADRTGTWTITVKGQQTGKSVSDTVVVKKKHGHKKHNHGH